MYWHIFRARDEGSPVTSDDDRSELVCSFRHREDQQLAVMTADFLNTCSPDPELRYWVEFHDWN